MGQGHDHSVSAAGNERKLAIAAALTGGFMLAEVVGGVVSGSLALIADAGHMLTDFASLLLALGAVMLTRRPASWKRSYGYDRFSVLAAFVNGLSLFLIAGWILYEAIKRFQEPVEVLGGMMFWVALGGLLVNILAFWILTRGEDSNLNVRAAALHVLGDLLGSVGAILASIIIMLTGWMMADPILSVLVTLLILRAAWKVVGESASILLESAPAGLEADKIERAILDGVPDAAGVRHIHAWSITEERPMLTMEVDGKPGADPKSVRLAVKKLLHDRFHVDHVTAEVDIMEAGALPEQA
ncbi:cation transporter [Parvularcula sp. ZS-1/3]|uniref:Cation transporter n=1 Tax=Parvularcula mediterranea TaxID=2732508 RepID=A0A7Y3RN07_9PROT|nr:cation diffusion facilitator family transporter [Parvularcula mediterranea]NNU17069.1 cation transporter [Parvularcula mediterranea]